MEDILSSIKRIIAEEGDPTAAASKARRASRAGATRAEAASFGHEEILELSEPVPASSDPVPEPTDAPEQAAAPSAPAPAEPILSPRTAEASRGSLDALSRLIVKPDVAGADTLEGLVREMIRPLLRDWLDARLPDMVEAMVAREIARITGQPQ